MPKVHQGFFFASPKPRESVPRFLSLSRLKVINAQPGNMTEKNAKEEERKRKRERERDRKGRKTPRNRKTNIRPRPAPGRARLFRIVSDARLRGGCLGVIECRHSSWPRAHEIPARSLFILFFDAFLLCLSLSLARVFATRPLLFFRRKFCFLKLNAFGLHFEREFH